MRTGASFESPNRQLAACLFSRAQGAAFYEKRERSRILTFFPHAHGRDVPAAPNGAADFFPSTRTRAS